MTKPKPKPLPVDRGRERLPADTSPADDQPEDSTETLMRILQQFEGGNGYSVRLERLRDVGMRAELTGYLGVMALTPDLYDDTMQAWGGGKYRGRIFRGSEYQTSIQFQISGEARPRDSHTFTGERPEQSPLEKQVAALADQVGQLVKQQQQQPQTSAVDQVVAIAKALREVAPPAAAATDPVAMFTMFDKMLDLRGRIAEETGDRPADNGITTIVREGIQPMISLVREHMANEKTNQRRAAPGAAAAAAGSVRSSTPSTDPIISLANRIPTMGRAFLAGLARGKKDPQLYAEMVLDQIPESDYQALPQLLLLPDFTTRMLAAVPEWQEFPVWFTELFRAMYESLTQEIVVEDAPPAQEVHAESSSREMHAPDQVEGAA
jgi:hypothetical protein